MNYFLVVMVICKVLLFLFGGANVVQMGNKKEVMRPLFCDPLGARAWLEETLS